MKTLDLNVSFKIIEMWLKPAQKTTFLHLPNLPFLLWRNRWQTFTIKNTLGFAGHRSLLQLFNL